jgi:hypothetical protein
MVSLLMAVVSVPDSADVRGRRTGKAMSFGERGKSRRQESFHGKKGDRSRVPCSKNQMNAYEEEDKRNPA